jgi:uncharacterized protein DUF1592/uncharacterized protein DUF1588/uncharacterized protein DUF1585/uncharacterized protein DUF1595/uncharacterized protein DUF1587
MKRTSLFLTPLCVALACSSDDGATSVPPPFEAPDMAMPSATAPSTDPPPASGAGLPLDGRPIFSQFVRLTHRQWAQSVRDVLRLNATPDLSDTFTSDPPEGIFSNNERSLVVTPNLSRDYQRAAEQLAERVTRDAQALARLDGFGAPAAFIAALGQRVYRRPLDPVEQQRYQTLFAAGPAAFASGDDFADGAQLIIESMLQSPYFLYRTELEDDGQPLSGYEVAAKLSFLFRDTTPDDTLLAAAAAGELSTPQGIATRALQLLEEAGAASTIARFNGEMFGLDRYSTIAKDPVRFPGYSSELNPLLQRAEERFLSDLFESGGGLTELLTSTRGFVDARTAALYGVQSGSEELEAVDLGPDRPGFFTRIGFLAYNGTLRDPDSIHRGVEINRVILCARLQPPPGVIPALPTIRPDQTNRERVSAHTGPGTCGAGCHATIINPIGFAFENFDALGQLRDTDNGKPVDTAGEYAFADGLKGFDGATGLMQLLAESPQAHACFAEHLMQFTLGRDLVEADRPLVDRLEAASLASRSSIKDLVLSVVTDPGFSHRPSSTVAGEAP